LEFVLKQGKKIAPFFGLGVRTALFGTCGLARVRISGSGKKHQLGVPVRPGCYVNTFEYILAGVRVGVAPKAVVLSPSKTFGTDEKQPLFVCSCSCWWIVVLRKIR
jgi:hypothetical protein